ncbi:hypothetical protein GQX73_g683 [Xylaria multiplex]|uniref:Uncharacterized protein n=1 Tax=Xylaria multiplex TaxID=323545 RepID=A0A7C8J373_9PEZI|nr:hypothetical protein GQX73_g683 [Xylaria multiplex]
MVTLRSKSQYEYGLKETNLQSTEHHKDESRRAGIRKSPRMRPGDDGLNNGTHHRTATTSLEKKGKVSSQDTNTDPAIPPKLNPETSRNREQSNSPHHDTKSSPVKKNSRAGMTRARAGKRNLKRNGGVRDNVKEDLKECSASVKKVRLEDQVPMIMECWQ